MKLMDFFLLPVMWLSITGNGEMVQAGNGMAAGIVSCPGGQNNIVYYEQISKKTRLPPLFMVEKEAIFPSLTQTKQMNLPPDATL